MAKMTLNNNYAYRTLNNALCDQWYKANQCLKIIKNAKHLSKLAVENAEILEKEYRKNAKDLEDAMHVLSGKPFETHLQEEIKESKKQ